MKAIYFFIALCCSALFTSAQVTRPGVVLHKDPRIDDLVKKQSDINKVAGSKTSSGMYKGYRVEALRTNDRNLAYKAKAQLLSRFSEYQAYVSYQAPVWRVRVGDFIKRNEAEDLRKRIAVLMTKDVYIVPDVVILKAEDEERLINEN